MIENSIPVNCSVVWSGGGRGRIVSGFGHRNGFAIHLAARFEELAIAHNVMSIENAVRLVARNLLLRSGCREMKLLYRKRRSVLIDSLRKELGFAVDVTGGQAGMHLCVSLSKKTKDVEASERAARQKLWLAPLSPCYSGRPSRQGFILGSGSTAVEEIPTGVRKLRNVIRAS